MLPDTATVLFLIPESIIDIRQRQIDIYLALFYMASGIFYRIFLDRQFDYKSVLPGVVFLILSFVTKSGIGLGDGLTILFMGLYYSFADMLMIIFSSLVPVFFFAAFYFIKKHNAKKTLPFIPFILIGTIIARCGSWI